MTMTNRSLSLEPKKANFKKKSREFQENNFDVNLSCLLETSRCAPIKRDQEKQIPHYLKLLST